MTAEHEPILQSETPLFNTLDINSNGSHLRYFGLSGLEPLNKLIELLQTTPPAKRVLDLSTSNPFPTFLLYFLSSTEISFSRFISLSSLFLHHCFSSYLFHYIISSSFFFLKPLFSSNLDHHFIQSYLVLF